jgi:type 1 glutamine amidotransferase
MGLWAAVFGPAAQAADKPAKIQVLVITGDDVSVHPWKEIADATTDAMAATGKFEVKRSEDCKPLESADHLKPYDVIVWTRFNTKPVVLSDQAKENLLDFVKGGKGFFVQHLASASFPKWDGFNKLCGRYWVMGKSGHGLRSVFESKIVDKAHPITKGLESFKTDDELYAKLQGDAPVHVLVEAYSDWSKKAEPLVFVQECGKGRVVHNAYGHDGKALKTPEVRKIIARGVEWAATGKVCE